MAYFIGAQSSRAVGISSKPAPVGERKSWLLLRPSPAGWQVLREGMGNLNFHEIH